MCGIVAGATAHNIVPILIDGLQRLEYRGYDSAGIAIITAGRIHRTRAAGKVASLAKKVDQTNLIGQVGIAHTRWATHGVPSEINAHPHVSHDEIAIVHNGVIENYLTLKASLESSGYTFSSDTDTEVIAHLLHQYYAKSRNLVEALWHAAAQLQGAYALAVCATQAPDTIVAIRQGSPLVLGISDIGHFVASDTFALLPVARQFVYLEDDDLAIVTRHTWKVYNNNQPVMRTVIESNQTASIDGKDGYDHFMQKEIYEQPTVIANTLEGRVRHGILHTQSFDAQLIAALKQTHQIDIVACGSSYHAGMVIKFSLEKAGVRTNVEQASEYLYRDIAVPPNTLFLAISQSGETADILASLEKAKQLPYIGYVGICNVPESALVRASQYVLLTRAGREIGVASTKAFVAQLVVLHMLTLLLQTAQGHPKATLNINAFERLPAAIEQTLQNHECINQAAAILRDAQGCLFLGRGECYPIAAEGALKLKEIAYIHAEAYPGGELKHGPLALVEENTPVVALIQPGLLGEKVIVNLQEVQARGGQLIIFTGDHFNTHTLDSKAIVLSVGKLDTSTSSIALVVPLQLLAYATALQKGTNVDQPRNLAKSVTVE